MNNQITIILLSHRSKNLVLNFIKDIHIKYKLIIIDNSNDIELKKIIKKKLSRSCYKYYREQWLWFSN